MQIKKKESAHVVAKNTFSNAFSGIIVQILSVVTGVFIARMFGAEGYGNLAFASVFSGYLMMGTDFGITSIAIRKASQNKKRYSEYLFTYLVSRGVLSVLAYGALIAVVYFTNFSKILDYLILLYGTLMFTRIANVNWIFIAHQRMEFKAICEVVEKGLYVVLIFACFFATKSIYIVPISMSLSSLFAACLGWYFLQKKFPKSKMALDKSFLKELLIHSWPVGFSNGASRINTNLDTIFIKGYSGSSVTGEYNAAYRLVNFMIMFGNFFTGAMYPLVCERVGDQKQIFEKIINKTTRILVYVFFPITVLLTILGPKLLTLLFGNGFVGGGIAVQILVWSAWFLLLSRFYGNVFVALKKQNVFMIIMVLSALLNVVLNFILIPVYSLAGAAIATVITEFTILLAAYLILKKQFDFVFVQPIVKALPACALMAFIVCFFSSWNVFFLLAIAVLVYIFVLYITGAIHSEDMELIKGLLKGLKLKVQRAKELS